MAPCARVLVKESIVMLPSGVFTGCLAKTTVHHRYSDLLRETCGEGFDIEYTAHFDRVSEDRIFVEFIDVQYKPKDNWLF
jgi:hypothetical protein